VAVAVQPGAALPPSGAWRLMNDRLGRFWLEFWLELLLELL